MRSFKKIAVLVIAKIEKSHIFNFSENKAPHEELLVHKPCYVFQSKVS